MAGPKKTVMVVDDAAMMRLVISNLISKNGKYEVIAALPDGAQALEKLKTLTPDVIFVDIEMPVMDGLTFLRHARLKTRAKIVVLSSIAGVGSPKALEARKLGADAVIQKPSGSVSLDLAEKSGGEILTTLQRLAPAA